MLAAIFALIESIPGFEKLLGFFISEYQNYKKAKEADAIAKAQKDSNSAETSDDIKKAAQEESDALKNL